MSTQHFVLQNVTYVHGGIDFADGFIICWELIYLYAIAHQLTHNLNFELMKLALGDCVRFGNDGNYVDLRKDAGKKVFIIMTKNIHQAPQYN